MSNTVAPFKYKAPLLKIQGVLQGGTATIGLPPVFRIGAIGLEASITKAAGGSGVKTFPLVSDIVAQYRVKVNGKAQRTRNGLETWGATGQNAVCDTNASGMVVYTQTNNSGLSVLPVLIGSAADLAQQALLTANTATTAVFQLPIQFSEPFRKEYVMTEAMALVQSRSDGTNVGAVTVEVDIPNNAGSSPAFTNPALKAYCEYDSLVAAPGAVITLTKEYRWLVPYTAAGDLEVAGQMPNRDALQRVSLLTTGTDYISHVVVKQGTTIIRDILITRAQAEMVRKDYPVAALSMNRFDIEFDENDDPNQAPTLNPSAPLSIIAPLSGITGSVVTVLASYFGPLD